MNKNSLKMMVASLLLISINVLAGGEGTESQFEPAISSVTPSLQKDEVIEIDDTLPMSQRGGDFTLYGVDGAVSLSDFRGKVVAIYFGYSQCPDVCPTNLALLGAALKQLSAEEHEHFQSIFISVDPGRDSPETLSKYTAFFHSDMIGLSATPDDIDPIVAKYGAYYEKTPYSNSAMLYGIAHTSETYIVGVDGRLSAIMPHASTPDDLLTAIKTALEAVKH